MLYFAVADWETEATICVLKSHNHHLLTAMPEPPSQATPPFVKAEDRLDSWKEIAAYLNRDVTTVQRWEKRERMPVHRHVHDRIGSVYASRAELDDWRRSRSRTVSENGADVPAPGLTPEPGSGSRGPSRWTPIALTAAMATVAIVLVVWLQEAAYVWRNPIADARFQRVTDFEGLAEATALSHDGRLLAFLSDRDGHIDVWVTQVGSGQFHNLTMGSAPELVNPSIRSLGFTPDGSFVTFWIRRQNAGNGDISIWSVPTLGGEPRPYLEGAAELDWSNDGSRLAYHTPGPGDPLFVSNGIPTSPGQPIFKAEAGLHSHFPAWSPDNKYIYLVLGSPPDKLDIWRIKPTGGTPERITSHNGTVIYPVLLDRRTLLYLSTEPDGSGPWLYGMDVERRIAHRLSPGLDRYTSLAASDDGRRLALTLATPKRTLWRVHLSKSAAEVAAPVPFSLTTVTGSSPRLGPNYLLYISSTGANESIWKVNAGTSKQLWDKDGAHILGSPGISADGEWIAFSVREDRKTMLYVMKADGTQARILTGSLELEGSAVWSSDGKAIIATAFDRGVPHLYRIFLDGRAPAVFVSEYSVNPAAAPDGGLVVYSGPDIGANFLLKAVTSQAAPHPVPPLTLTRGARHVAFLAGGQTLVVLRGEIQHKDLWLVELSTGAQRQLTNFPPDFNILDFDISPDGRDLVVERVQEHSDVVLMDLPRR